MLDIQFIRDNADLVKEKSKQKGYDVDIGKLLSLDKNARDLIPKIEELRSRRRQLADSSKGQKPGPEQISKGQEIKDKLGPLEDQLAGTQAEFKKLLLGVPNMPLDDVPIGASEDENQVVKTWGEKPTFNFKPKTHAEIGEAKGWIDKERAAKVAGSRFAYLKGDLVMLQFALWQFALSILTSEEKLKEIISTNNLKASSKPFIPVLPPAVARTEVYEATGRLDKEQQTYKLADDDLWLNASAEHTLAPMYINEILDEKNLPIRYVGYTTAFRREAGTYGKDMDGILRQHQFDKLEMESFTLPDESLNEHLFLVAIQEYLMQQLEIPYQLILKCTADIGGPNARGMDVNAWMAGQNKYRETHTADLITDYQTRRLQTKVRRQDGSVQLAHTNDATAFAQRPLIAIIENNQTADGNVKVPKILQPYMNGRDQI